MENKEKQKTTVSQYCTHIFQSEGQVVSLCIGMLICYFHQLMKT